MVSSEILANLFIAIAIIGVIVYLKLMNNKPKEASETEKLMVDILNSDEYKVKGKYE
jgi:hypothetical protein